MDKVFKDMEMLIGSSKFIGEGAEHVFNLPSYSIRYLGLIATASLLSPSSHNKESISLYTDYTTLLESNIEKYNEHKEKSKILLKDGFKGFFYSRFGRSGKLSTLFIHHQDIINVFQKNG